MYLLPPPLTSGQRWPSLVQENRPQDRCVVRYLGAPPEQQQQQRRPGGGSPAPAAVAAAAAEEVDASSLVKFPGGQSLVATGWEPLALPAAEEVPADVKGAKEAKDAHIRREFLLPANEARKVTVFTRYGSQRACDTMVRNVVRVGWVAGANNAREKSCLGCRRSGRGRGRGKGRVYVPQRNE